MQQHLCHAEGCRACAHKLSGRRPEKGSVKGRFCFCRGGCLSVARSLGFCGLLFVLETLSPSSSFGYEPCFTASPASVSLVSCLLSNRHWSLLIRGSPSKPDACAPLPVGDAPRSADLVFWGYVFHVAITSVSLPSNRTMLDLLSKHLYFLYTLFVDSDSTSHFRRPSPPMLQDK